MRQPAVAGRFYPRGRDELIECIDWCFTHPLGPGSPGFCSGAKDIRAAMAPHAGYVCSGMTAARTYRALAEDGRHDVYIVIGPDHYGTVDSVAMCSEDFLTPLGVCEVDKGLVKALKGIVPDIPRAHSPEHSVEVQVPFIQTIDPDARILPIIMGRQDPDMAEALSSVLTDACEGLDAVVIASTDMSHYVPKSKAERDDGDVLDRVKEMDVEGMYRTVVGRRITMCGYGPTAVAMMFADGCSCDYLGHTDSYDALGLDPDAVVGYASAVFRKD